MKDKEKQYKKEIEAMQSKDSVVLSKEEYKNLKHYENEMYRLQGVVDTLTNEGWDILDEKKEKIRKVERKETAEKILRELSKNKQYDFDSFNHRDWCVSDYHIRQLAKQFGVEIKE